MASKEGFPLVGAAVRRSGGSHARDGVGGGVGVGGDDDDDDDDGGGGGGGARERYADPSLCPADVIAAWADSGPAPWPSPSTPDRPRRPIQRIPRGSPGGRVSVLPRNPDLP